MPELLYEDIAVKLPSAVRKTYNAMEGTFLAELDNGVIAAANAAVASGKLRQIVNGALYTEGLGSKKEYTVLHNEKIDAVEDLLEQLGGKPVLLLYEFDFERDMLQKRFNCPALGGGVSTKKAAEIEAAFNRGEIPLLIGQPQAMGHGLNLQEVCHHVVWYGLTWNLELYDQATRRVYRQGQRADTVFVYRLVAEDTIDEVVSGALAGKDRTQTALMGSLSQYRKKML
jgi:SNF2 family DNA or RNA helicase